MPSNPSLSPDTLHESLGVKTSNVFRYRAGFVRDGKRHWITPWRDNLIQDAGMNKIGSSSLAWVQCFGTCLFGNNVSPSPIQRAPGIVTFTQTGTTITASGNFFLNTDTGALFKWGTGTGGVEGYITYVNATTVTYSVSQTVAVPTPGTIWFVNTPALSTLYATTSTYGSNGGDNSSSIVGNVVTHKRTFVGAAVAGPVTLTEIGFNDTTSNSNLFDRDIITGGVALTTGDQPLAVCQLIQTFTPTTSTAASNVGTGCDSTGNFLIEWLQDPSASSLAVGSVATNGNSNVGGVPYLEPYVSNVGGAIVGASLTLQSFSTSSGTLRTGQTVIPTLIGYVAGSFNRDKRYSLSISQANGTIQGVTLTPGGSGATSFNCGLTQKFTTPFTKSSSQTLVIDFNYAWARTLTN